MAIDVAPELAAKVQADFRAGLAKNEAILEDAKIIGSGRGTFARADHYAEAVGGELSKALLSNLTAETLPNGRLYYNIAERVMGPVLLEEAELVEEATAQVVDQLNKKAGIGLTATRPGPDAERIEGVISTAASLIILEEATRYIGEAVINFALHGVDRMVKHNADYQKNCGLHPKIVRSADGGACKWCQDLTGTYEYPVRNDDVFRRHENCRCSVEFVPAKGRPETHPYIKAKSDAATLATRRSYGLE